MVCTSLLSKHDNLAREEISADIADVIQQDLRTLRNHAVGGRSTFLTGYFVKVSNAPTCIYVYQHGTTVACSGTKFSQIKGCVEVDYGDGCMALPTCAHRPAEHYSLLPFYYNNATTLQLYKELEHQETGSLQC